jgi:acetyltransferase-like isoleucine patch superfamily enzyme
MHGPIRRARKLILRAWYRGRFRSCGRNFRWDPVSSFFAKPSSAEIGDNVFLGEGFQGINLPVVIEQDVWIGAAVIILKGVTIGEGAVIGAGSLVTKDIPPYTIAVGTPAKSIKKRFSDEELKRHLELLDYRGESIAAIIDRRNRHFD